MGTNLRAKTGLILRERPPRMMRIWRTNPTTEGGVNTNRTRAVNTGVLKRNTNPHPTVGIVTVIVVGIATLTRGNARALARVSTTRVPKSPDVKRLEFDPSREGLN